MSLLASKLFEEREEKKANYLPLLCNIYGNDDYDPALNENEAVSAMANDNLCSLAESNPLGGLQMYVLEEYFLHGKSKEEIGKEIADNMDLLLTDLINPALRYLRHPDRAKALHSIVKKND